MIAARLKLAVDHVAPPPNDGQRRAAVAILLAANDVLLMERAKRDGDPWSGHISLPGGGYHETDGDLCVTAMRETREEVGIELAQHRYAGALPALHPLSSGPAGVEVTPHVFVVEGVVPVPVLGAEAAGTFWFPLDRALAGEFDAEYEFVRAGTTMRFPSWRYENHTIWGLTWRILTELAAAAR